MLSLSAREGNRKMKPICDCGHNHIDHYLHHGRCKECACNWYVPRKNEVMVRGQDGNAAVC